MDVITVKLDIKVEDLRSLLVGAFENGSNYWMGIDGVRLPKDTKRDDYNEGGKYDVKAKYRSWTECYVLPFIEGGGVVIREFESEDGEEDKIHVLTLDKIKSGIQLMAEKWPHHFSDVLNENTDMETSDVFLQLCIFGDVIYG